MNLNQPAAMPSPATSRLRLWFLALCLCLVPVAAHAQHASAGLWVGRVSLDHVTDPKGALTAAGGTFEFTVIFHVGTNGTVKLLKDVIVMQRDADNNPATAPEIVLVTDPAKIAGYKGVIRRTDGRSTGIRYAASAYDFPSLDLAAAGHLAPDQTVEYTINTADNAPTNPFRHKFHPDHATGRPYSRAVTLNFKGATTTDTASGTRRLTGTYKEVIRTLVKYDIQLAGTVVLERVSPVATLNP